MRAHRVAAYFRDHLIGDVVIFQGDAPVPRADDVADVAALQTGEAQQLGQQFIGRFLHVQSGGDQRGDDFLAVQKHAFGAA